MNGMATVVDALTRTPRPPPAAYIVEGKGKTGALRAMLLSGPVSCSDLSEASGLTRKLVGDLLSNDVRLGRVAKSGAFYSLAPEFDEEELRRIRGAAALLRANGYLVRKLPVRAKRVGA